MLGLKSIMVLTQDTGYGTCLLPVIYRTVLPQSDLQCSVAPSDLSNMHLKLGQLDATYADYYYCFQVLEIYL